jgi:hypothetical protein
MVLRKKVSIVQAAPTQEMGRYSCVLYWAVKVVGLQHAGLMFGMPVLTGSRMQTTCTDLST